MPKRRSIAEALGLERPEWELAAGHLAWAIRNRPHAFLDKSRWSMDWYYPVLTGVLRGAPAVQRIDAGWDTFVIDPDDPRSGRWAGSSKTECGLHL